MNKISNHMFLFKFSIKIIVYIVIIHLIYCKNNTMAHKGDIEGIKIISMGVTLSETILTFVLCGNKNGV